MIETNPGSSTYSYPITLERTTTQKQSVDVQNINCNQYATNDMFNFGQTIGLCTVPTHGREHRLRKVQVLHRAHEMCLNRHPAKDERSTFMFPKAVESPTSRQRERAHPKGVLQREFIVFSIVQLYQRAPAQQIHRNLQDFHISRDVVVVGSLAVLVVLCGDSL